MIFKKEDGKYIFPDKKLEEVGIKNNSIIYAEYDEENENIYGIPEEDLESLKKTMKEKYKQGLITIQIINIELGSDFYYVKKNVKFKMVADDFKNKNPGKKWFFIAKGKVIDEQSQEKTLKELGFKILTKVLAEECEDD